MSQVWIQDFAKAGTASGAESRWRSEAELCGQSQSIAARVQGSLKGRGSFWIFNAQRALGPPGSATGVPLKYYQFKLWHLAQTFVSI